MKKILSVSFFLLLLLVTACTGNDYDVYSTIYGVVSDASTGEPIESATVQLSPGGETKLTGSDGYFEFNDITSQQYTVTVQKGGYSTNRKSITAVLGEKTHVNITLNKGK